MNPVEMPKIRFEVLSPHGDGSTCEVCQKHLKPLAVIGLQDDRENKPGVWRSLCLPCSEDRMQQWALRYTAWVDAGRPQVQP